MRRSISLLFLLFSVGLSACSGPEPVAKGYIDKLEQGAPSETPDDEDKDEPAEETAEQKSIKAGLAIINGTCMSCHSGSSSTKLIKSNVGKLSSAATGTAKGFHTTVKDKFDSNFDDIEAAMNTLN